MQWRHLLHLPRHTHMALKKRGTPVLSQLADAIVLSGVRAATGGRLRIALSGGAAISRETQEFLTTALVTMTEARFLASASTSASASLEFWGSAATRATIMLQWSTVMDALIPLVAAVSKAMTFEDAVEAWKLGGEGTAKLMAKRGRATYVMDTGNLPPEPGAMSLVLLTKGMMDGLAREAEGV